MSELVLTEEQFESFAEYRQNYHNFRKGKAKGSDGETKEALHQYAPAERSTSATTTTYIPVDYSAGALEENATVYNNFEHRAKNMKIECFVGTNDVALEELSKNEHAKERKTFIFLGNTIGNDLDPVRFYVSKKNIFQNFLDLSVLDNNTFTILVVIYCLQYFFNCSFFLLSVVL